MAAAEEEAGYGAPEEAPVPRASVSTPRLSEVGELAEKIMDDAEVNTLSPDVPHLSLWAPEQRHLVVMLFKALLGSCTLLSAVFITLLLLFFGSGWNPAWYYWRIKIGVLDLDGALVGTALRGVANSGKVPFTTVDLSGSTFDSVKQSVDAGHLNAAWIAMPGATAALLSAAASPTAAYNSAGAMSFIFDEGRGGATMASLLTGATSSVRRVRHRHRRDAAAGGGGTCASKHAQRGPSRCSGHRNHRQSAPCAPRGRAHGCGAGLHRCVCLPVIRIHCRRALTPSRSPNRLLDHHLDCDKRESEARPAVGDERHQTRRAGGVPHRV